MTSQLASQLQRLQQRPVGDKRLSQSFLFDSKEARNFSREQVHELAVYGLQTLIAIDNRFHPFLEDLFHPQKTRVERKLLSTEENQSIDATLERFLTLLSPHMFLTAAHQVFEYLVRVHEVHVYNVEAVLRTFMPYHDHSLFARALMLLDLRDTGFAFLQKNQEHGAPLLREHLVLACAGSRKALRLVCLTLAMSVRLKVHNGAANALFTSVAVRLASHPDAEALWRVLMPFIVEFLSGAVSGAENGEMQQELRLHDDVQGGTAPPPLPSREVMCGALVVLAAWSNEVQLSVPTLATLMKPIIRFLKAAGDANPLSGVLPTSDLLGIIDIFFFTQRAAVSEVTFDPQIQLLLALRWRQWVPWIAAAGAGMYESIITVLLRYCLQRLRVAHSIESVASDVLCFVQCALEELPLTDALVTDVIQTLMACHVQEPSQASLKGSANKNGEEGEEGEREEGAANSHDGKSNGTPAPSVTKWMGALERRFPHVFDATLSRLLNDVATQATAAAFVSQHFSGTRYELVEVQGLSGKTERLPLFSCLLHPIPEVRLLAAKAMEVMEARQLITSSSAPGSSGAGNSLLELLEHVVRYEQSYQVAQQFLRTSAAAVEKLLVFLDNRETTSGASSSPDERVVISHLRSVFCSLWTMVTQHGISLQRDFFTVVLQPVLHRVESHSSGSQAKTKRKNKKAVASSTGGAALQNSLFGPALYYVTLQYLDATHQQATGYTLDDTEETRISTEVELRKWILDLERQLSAVMPNISRTGTLFALTGNSEVSCAEKNEAADGSGDDDDDDVTENRENRAVRVSKNSTFSKEANNGYLSVFECVPLLQLLREEGSARLPSTLEHLRSKVEEDSFSRGTKVTMLECCLACASCLTTPNTSDIDAVTQTLLQFFVGESGESTVPRTGSDGSYLGNLQETQRAASRKDREKVGRSAKGALTTLCVPKNELTAEMGATVRRSMEVRLRNEGDACNELPVLVRMALLLGFLSTPLPAVALNPAVFSPVYLRLLEQNYNVSEEVQFPVDWFGLVYTSVFRASGSAVPVPTGGRQFSLSALFLTLFCPLAAPTDRRERVLRELQSIVLAVSRGKSDAVGTLTKKRNNKSNGTVVATGAQMSVEFALREEQISATTLNAIIESIMREESRGNLTHSAAELLSRMMAEMSDLFKNEPAVPFAVSRCALEHFFPLSAKATRGESATCSIVMKTLLPILKTILTMGGTPSNANDAGAVSVAAADFLHAACVRADLIAAPDGDEDARLELCLALIQHPFLRVRGGRVRPVHRHALTALATALSHGLDGRQTNSVLFVPQNQKASSSSKASRGAKKASMSEDYLCRIASEVSQVLLTENAHLSRLGADATLLLTGTLGGYHRLFLPWVGKLLQQSTPDLSLVVDVVEGLAAPAATEVTDAWEPPSWCALHNPLTFSDAQSLLQLCRNVCETSHGKGPGFWMRHANILLVLRLLCSLITISPSICVTGDDDDSDDSSSSLFAFIDTLLESFPLDSLWPLLVETADSNDDAEDELSRVGGQLMFSRWAFAYVRGLVDLCVLSPQALNEGQPQGAACIGRTLVKQCVMLMAALLAHDAVSVTAVTAEEEEEKLRKTEKAKRKENGEATALSRHRIDLIAELLRIVSPLCAPASPTTTLSTSGAVESRAAGQAALCVPLVALLIRLETVDFSAHGLYEDAVDLCSKLLTRFDVHTQLGCLTQMMRLLIDPHQQLSIPTKKRQKEAEENGDNSVVKLFRKLLKPNQVINRQEVILNLINSTVKSEAFLSGFLGLQHHQDGSCSVRPKQDDESNEKTEETDGRTNDECMTLLVASLELFSHYTEMNAATANDALTVVNGQQGSADEEQLEYGENKAYTMLLELLAGNTLACVLAGINEPTFVACLERLLTDRRAALQQKGLEALLDRLHHALPTVENTLSDAEVEEHRRKLRDPKRKLTLMDLVRLKARPLVTKQSFALFQHLSAIMHACAKSTTPQSTEVRPLQMLSFSVSCMEELVRIIGSGGSLQAEKTLLNVHHASRVTEVTLSNLFGTKARVREVHRWVGDIVTLVPLLLQGITAGGAATAAPTSSSLVKEGDLVATSSSVVEDTLLAAASLLTALGTICQVMGTAFIMSHSNAVLETVTNAAVLGVAHVVPVVSRSGAGSLLRQASLGCLLRVFPCCWLMCHPYLSRIMFAATHLHNVDDTETNYRSGETMAMLEAVLEPQLFIEACAECLRAVTTVCGKGARKSLRVRVDTHSFPLLYASVRRRIESLQREEIKHLSVLVEGTTIKDNFWLASLHALAAAPALPSQDIIQSVLEAYAVFFLKFKAKHCVRYLSTAAEWAFGGASEDFLKRMEKQQRQQDDTGVVDGREKDGVEFLPRSTIHSWLLFYALCNHLLEKLGSIMDFGFPVILPYIVGTLTGYCSSSQRAMRHLAGLIALTLEGALDSVRRIALAQTAGPDHDHSIPVDNYLETPEVFGSVMPAVVRQVTNLTYLADGKHDYVFRAEHHVIPAVRALFQSLTSSKLQSRMQNELLKALRHPSRHVRRMALLCLDGIYADGGDELASRLMAEMLPAVVEMTEDRDDDVVEQARKLCNNLSTITGQDVLYAMGS